MQEIKIEKVMTDKFIIGKIEQLSHEGVAKNNISYLKTKREIELEEEIELLKTSIKNFYLARNEISDAWKKQTKAIELKNQKLKEDNLFLAELLVNKYKSFLSPEELDNIKTRFSISKYGKKIKDFLNKL